MISVIPVDEDSAQEPIRLRGWRAADGNGERQLAKIVPDRRRHRRVSIRVFGRFMRTDKQEYPCQVVNMSAGGIAVLAPVAVEPGERIVAYLDNFGRLEGMVARTFEGGFAMRFHASSYKREKIANLLTWMVNQETLGLTDERRHERVVPRNPSSKLILPNGEVHPCRVIDVSLSGASITSDVRPAVDTVVVLGRTRGRVVRHHDQGVAIQFIDVQDPDSIARSFG